MTIREMIEQLEILAQEHGDNTKVNILHEPVELEHAYYSNPIIVHRERKGIVIG